MEAKEEFDDFFAGWQMNCNNLTAFAERTGLELSVMPDAEHWFHTEEQMRFLDNWLSARI